MTIATRNENAASLPEKPKEVYRTPNYSALISAKQEDDQPVFLVNTPYQNMGLGDLEDAIGRFTELADYARAVKEAKAGFTHAATKTHYGVDLEAEPGLSHGGRETFLVTYNNGTAAYHTKASCIDVAEFFTKLAEELARRGY